jgi:hypothetical protein
MLQQGKYSKQSIKKQLLKRMDLLIFNDNRSVCFLKIIVYLVH